jgi:hypothetical protein
VPFNNRLNIFHNSQLLMRAGICGVLCFFILRVGFTETGHAQEGTVQSSWEKSKKNPGAANTGSIKTSEKNKYWDKDSVAYWKRQAAPQPVPPKTATPGSVSFKTNESLIDSLAHLYCVSASYIVDLRIQNHVAFDQPRDSVPSVRKPATPSKSPTITSLSDPQSLYKKLVELLNRCLHGK